MEIHSHNTRADYQAFYEDVWCDRKKSFRSDFYQNLTWYLSVLALAAYAALQHEEIFIACVMGTLAFFYLRTNWSFEKSWEERAQEYARTGSEAPVIFKIDNESITEVCQGITITVPWEQIHEYSLNSERLILHYAIQRGLILPVRFITSDVRELIFSNLESRKIQNKSLSVQKDDHQVGALKKKT